MKIGRTRPSGLCFVSGAVILALSDAAKVFRAAHGADPSVKILSARALADAKVSFQFLDSVIEKNGKITVNEMATWCTINGIRWKQGMKLFMTADKNKDKVIDEKEWKELSEKEKARLHADLAHVDVDGDNDLSVQEWNAYCEGWMSPQPAKARCHQLFHQADKNDNGRISSAEYAGTAKATEEDGKEAKKEEKKTADDDKKEAKRKNGEDQDYNKCGWISCLLLLTCCCINPAAQYFHMRGPENRSQGLIGQALGILGCLIPFLAVIYLFWWSELAIFGDNDKWDIWASGTLCGWLVIWACLYTCLSLCQIGFICATGGATALMAMAGGGKM